MLNAELKILAGKYQGKAIPLATRRFLVGREQDCQLRPNSEMVSRHHCVFIVDDYAVRLRDLGSTNGTRVNGDLLRGEIVLNSGDRIVIGRLEVELNIRQHAVVEANAAVPGPAAASAESTLPTPPEFPVVETGTSLVNSGDTSFEIPSMSPVAPEQMPTVANIGGDTAIIPGASGAPMVPLANPQMMPMGYPMGYGFPGQMPGFMPGYGMPQGFPMAMPGMPMMPQYPQPQAPVQAGAATVSEPPVRLPDPSSTGAKAPVPPAGQAAAPGAAAAENPSQSAADIIKQFMQRRT